MATFANSVSIIVPTRNEAENVAPLVSQIVSRPVRLQEILFVDDSTDATRDVIRQLTANYPVPLIEQDHAQSGLAAAVMSGGFRHVCGRVSNRVGAIRIADSPDRSVAYEGTPKALGAPELRM
jgi:glycosyltransferase involved in cell wall biosynthesis